MLTQLTRLSVETDGRYAKLEEVQFLKDYLQSMDVRLSAYEKIRAAQEQIILQVEVKMCDMDPSLFRSAAGEANPEIGSLPKKSSIPDSTPVGFVETTLSDLSDLF